MCRVIFFKYMKYRSGCIRHASVVYIILSYIVIIYTTSVYLVHLDLNLMYLKKVTLYIQATPTFQTALIRKPF